ncbi:hypothetical protein GCM10009733_007940 [Nonomuraea maheshkhaliensis]|uniref:Uncharacterized protein n=1 Tax=Nonomuraea maheshkhaliensis TaxID=419590 RepID=A0ABN2EQ05_9ACTN
MYRPARALLAAAVPVLELARHYDDDRLNRAALGAAWRPGSPSNCWRVATARTGYAGPRDVLDVELAGASVVVQTVRHGSLPTDGLALLDWDALLRAAAAAYDRATAHLREEREPEATL